MNNNSKLKKIFYIFLVFIAFISCDDKNEWIPNVRVSENIFLSQIANLGPLQATYWEGGVNGLIIFRLPENEFNVFDRMCPYEASTSCSVEIKDEMFAECPCCDSKFTLEFNSLLRGPANRPLHQYRTAVQGNMLYITN